MNLTSYHAKYFAYELTRQHASDNIQKFTASLSDAQVDLNPHQVEAALFAFKSPLSKGAILADEVGLGKTIEAGIILSQKWAERKRKLLIIAPANLRKQWSQELADKFYLPSVILESSAFQQAVKKGNLNPFIQPGVVICSYQFACSKKAYLLQANWDLVIIDEAHRLRNVYKSGNKIASSIKEALAHAPKVLLTATPLQNSLLELYGLVSIIDEYTFGDLKSFKSQFSKLADEENFDDLKKRLEPVCKRTLRRQVVEYINYTNRIAIVEEFYPFKDEESLYEQVSEYLRQPVLYALPASQRQLMTLIMRKLLASSSFAVQRTFEALAGKLELLLKAQHVPLEDLLGAEYEPLQELKDEWDEDGAEIDPAAPLSPDQVEEVKKEIVLLRRFREMASTIVKNSKGEKLVTALEKGFEKLHDIGAAQKAIIFTESTRTQTYLKALLEDRGYAGRIVLFNGSNTDGHSKQVYRDWLHRHAGTDKITGASTADMRQALVDCFRQEATIMIATEAAAEGINLQFCSLVVNYDLPWNPQRIEQRIGRCHRYGQKFDVVVVNFLNRANAADMRVYQLLDEKFRLFDGVFGASDEVLGSIENGIDFEKRIARIYQECRRPEEIQAAFDELQRELEPHIAENMDHTRRQLLENFDEEVHRKLRFHFEKGKEYLGRYEQWLWNLTRYFLKDHAHFNGEDDSFRLHTNPFPEADIHHGPYQLLRTATDRKKSETDLADDTNIYRRNHPLAQRIVAACKKQPLPVREVIFDYEATPVKISVLEALRGQAGWMQMRLFSIASFETEEHVVLSGVSEQGQVLPPDVCTRFFSLWATEGQPATLPPLVENQLLDHCHAQQQTIRMENNQRNTRFFDDEYGKLDKWADDMRLSLERELKDLEAELKLRKAEVRKILNLNVKIKEQRLINDLERKRIEKRKNLFAAQDQIDSRKDELLANIEARLKQEATEETVFTLYWKLV